MFNNFCGVQASPVTSLLNASEGGKRTSLPDFLRALLAMHPKTNSAFFPSDILLDTLHGLWLIENLLCFLYGQVNFVFKVVNNLNYRKY